MFCPLQNATSTVPPSDFQTLVVFNVNFALLFLVLSVLYMILTDRKVLFSTRVRDVAEWGNVFHYVVIAVVQAFFITAIQGTLESLIHLKFIDLGMTVFLIVALLAENLFIQNRVT